MFMYQNGAAYIHPKTIFSSGKDDVTMFINFTNHSSALWNDAQRTAAEKYGEIRDIPFPAVDPALDSNDISSIAADYAEMISSYSPEAVLVQGEMTLCYAVISALLDMKIKVVCATTERISQTHIGPNNETVRTSEFHFVQFRKYARKFV